MPLRKLRVGFVALVSLTCAVTLHAQDGACGLTSMQQTGDLHYPPIARAAHVRGVVVMLVSFASSGEVTAVRVVSGPEMLKSVSEKFVKQWHANTYEGSRECPVAITFELIDPKDGQEASGPAEQIVKQDLQHITIRAKAPIINTQY